MEQQTPLLSVSFLPTKQDYADYQIAACNAAASPGERLFLRAAGFVLVVAGFVLCLLFGVGNPQNTVFFSLLVLLGLAVGFFTIPSSPCWCAAARSRFTTTPGSA